MTVLGLGVDIVHVPRIAAILRSGRLARFAARILSKAEYEQWLGLSPLLDDDRARFLSVRWAVKEAAYKAMAPIKPTWKELTYYRCPGHKPRLLFHPTLETKSATIGTKHVSVSHDGEYVFASVLVEGTHLGS